MVVAPRKSREFSWSLSRARLFQECPRKFYYQYYFAKTGFYPDAPEEARLAHEMKSIKGLDMWAGEVVHETIQWVLEQSRAGIVPTEADARSEVRRRLSHGWQGSVRQLWRLHPDELYPNLFEHYYKLPAGSAATDRIKSKAFTSITNFMGSNLLRHISTTPTDRWLPIEKYSSFRMDGLLFYVKFDFALKEGQQITVYDWKTGAPTEQENLQLACYALYASSYWNIPLENIKVCAAHLQPELNADERFVDIEDVQDVRAYAKQSFNSMLGCLRDPSRNLAAMDDFPMTGNLMRCLRCNFRGICLQAKMAQGDIEDLPVVEDWEG